ncbi:MAG: AAA domain-containing protein [Alphaproteobacteria bacterium]|nr:AAA domain-containing protein [Alphaproteobacteria bacterium]
MEDLIAETASTAAQLKDVRTAIGAAIFGQEKVIEQSLIALLSGGHLLLVGVPGLGKTKLVDTLARSLGIRAARVQCTPDLMPADILGSEILEETESGSRAFRFIHGPVFTQLLMADEINRASPRTQSALLQAMQERSVTIAGQDHALPAPFHVLATQNPIEQEGTYPLPEAQLDRFMLQIDIDYPDAAAERHMTIATTGANDAAVTPRFSAAQLLAAQKLVRRMPISDRVVDGIMAIVRQGRPESTNIDAVKEYVAWGPGPRAAQALALASRARALLDGRLSPSLDDVLALLMPALQHRMALQFSARAEGVQLKDIIALLAEAAG